MLAIKNLKWLYAILSISGLVLSTTTRSGEMFSPQRKANTKVIVDIDSGIDDIEALVILINEHNKRNLQIVGIVVSEGNTAQPFGIKNVYRLLTVANRLSIPVFYGSRMQILPHVDKLENFYGADGFGDLKWSWEPFIFFQQDIAPVVIHKLVNKYPNQIIYVNLGSMTNLALSMRMYDNVTSKLGNIIAMGGLARDKTNQVAEFNIAFDPEAAAIVLEELQSPMTLFTFEDACTINAPSRGWLEKEDIKNPVFEMVKRAETSLTQMHYDEKSWISCDPEAVIAFLREEAIISSYETPLTVLLDRGDNRGVIRNYTEGESERNPVRVITEFNMDMMRDIFIESFQEVCQTHRCNNQVPIGTK